MKLTFLFAVFVVATLCLASAVVAQYKHYTKSGGYIACVSKDDLDKVIEFSVDHDLKALRSIVDGKRCIILKAGVPCYIMSGWIGEIKIRPEGSEVGLWTVSEAIK